MFIRVYMNASTEMEAENYLQSVLHVAERVNVSLNKEKCVPFLDFDNSFEIELESNVISEQQIKDFLEGIAPKWHELPNSLIATKQENNLYINEIEMIEVYPEI